MRSTSPVSVDRTSIGHKEIAAERLDELSVKEVVSLIKERATFVGDLWEQGSFFFEAPSGYDEKASKKALKEDTPELMNKLISITLLF